MKSVLAAVLVSAFASVSSASTIAVTGGGILDTFVFSVSGDNFNGRFALPGADSVIPCREGTTCQATITNHIGPLGGGGNEFFQGQTGVTIAGEVTVTYSLTVPMRPWPSNSLTGTASVSATFTGYRDLLLRDPFFSASITGEGTVTTYDSGNPLYPTDPTYRVFYSPGYQFSGVADVTAISGSEVPEPNSLLLIAGGLGLVIMRGRLRLLRR
jgi:hypothetical protein